MIELTESAWTVDAEQTLAVVSELRAAGATFAIDDFGVRLLVAVARCATSPST